MPMTPNPNNITSNRGLDPSPRDDQPTAVRPVAHVSSSQTFFEVVLENHGLGCACCSSHAPVDQRPRASNRVKGGSVAGAGMADEGDRQQERRLRQCLDAVQQPWLEHDHLPSRQVGDVFARLQA